MPSIIIKYEEEFTDVKVFVVGDGNFYRMPNKEELDMIIKTCNEMKGV